MGRARFWVFALGGAVAATLLGAAQRPQALAITSPGMWEITGAAGVAGPLRQCIADTTALARIEHRGQTCTHVVISDAPGTAVIHYTCPKGGFGQSKLTVITPRSLRIETQGIAGALPFNYVVQARRTGNCPAH